MLIGKKFIDYLNLSWSHRGIAKHQLYFFIKFLYILIKFKKNFISIQVKFPSVHSGIAKLHHVPPHLIPLLSGVCGQYKWYSLSKNQVQSLALPLDTGPHHSEPQFSHLSDGIVTVGVFLTGLSGDKDVGVVPG